MRYLFLLAAMTISLAGCIMDPGTPYDPRPPQKTSELKPINPYKVDRIPDTAYEIWKRDKDRNDRIEGRDDDTYPPLFKGQGSGKSGGAQ
ncbi:MAG: hypothetical protein R3C46_08835 [Hyphomonadaceae bacterium]